MILKYMFTVFPNTGKKDYVREIALKTKNMINFSQDSKKSMLLDYLFDEMPKKLVKCVLKIYDDEYDTDKENTPEILFNKISEILKLGTSTILLEKGDLIAKDDNILLFNLKEYIYPYFKEYFNIMINSLKVTMDDYIKTLSYNAELIKTVVLIMK